MARQQPPERGPVAIDEVVTAALDMTAYAVRTSGIQVTLDQARDIPHVLADADQIHQVLLNLIINAQQALQERPAPRRIRLVTHYDPSDDRVRITVADNGPGIPSHLRARVFEPYFTTKPTGIGTGVGLAVSLGIVEAHGGELTVECPDEGGAVFTIALPVTCIEATDMRPQPPQLAGPKRRSILIVDDESEIREALSRILSGVRNSVVTVGSGHEALEQLAAEDYDVILTDVRMPGLDGRALYQEIARRWPRRAGHVVFVTGDTLSASLNEFVSESGRPVIHKPFLPADVRRVIEEVVAAGESSSPVSTAE
jgi:two-component system NtrC family sensor kinase